MSDFQESDAKDAIRRLLRDSCEELSRGALTYLGMPGERVLDLKVLRPLVERAICVERRPKVMSELKRNLAFLPLKEKRYVEEDMWQYLRDRYKTDELTADVTFLDFCGGGIQSDDPFELEIGGLRDYFMKHAAHPSRAFVLAWTYMPRDRGKQVYIDALANMGVEDELLSALHAASGMWARSLAIRILLWRSLREHQMSAKVVQHAVYKRVMNAIIVVYSKGADPNCPDLGDPRCVLTDPAWIYDPAAVTPIPVWLIQP